MLAVDVREGAIEQLAELVVGRLELRICRLMAATSLSISFEETPRTDNNADPKMSTCHELSPALAGRRGRGRLIRSSPTSRRMADGELSNSCCHDVRGPQSQRGPKASMGATGVASSGCGVMSIDSAVGLPSASHR